MARIINWDNPEKELHKRLNSAQSARKPYEKEWLANESVVFQTRQNFFGSGGAYAMLASGASTASASEETSDLYINMISRDVRFAHSTISANPPVVAPKALSNDPSDQRKAEAADHLVHYAVRAYDINNKKDIVALQTLVLGTGFIKSYWNPNLGDIIDADPDTLEVTLQGDYDLQVCNAWDIFPDPEAKNWEAVRYVFERHLKPLEEVRHMFPDKEHMLIQAYSDAQQQGSLLSRNNETSDCVEIFEYWEKGLPINGYQGRHCWMLPNGKLLTKLTSNPLYYTKRFEHAAEVDEETGEPLTKKFKIAVLPYHIWTDLDLPHTYWGMAAVSYSGEAQETMNKFINQSIDIFKANGTPKLMLHESSEVDEADLNNSAFEVIRYKGPLGSVYKMEGSQPVPGMMEYTQFFKQAIMELNGANEATYGQQSRETSAYAMQWASQQTQAMRRRLFIKYTKFVEEIYRSYLNIVKEYWDTSRTVRVLSPEDAFLELDISGADIEGGWDISVEYGTNLSLDPSIRREELMNLKAAGITDGAGISDRQLLQHMRMSNFSGLVDKTEQASKRQYEIFMKMVVEDRYIAPRKLQNHELMLEYANDYVMSPEYRDLSEEHKELIDRHIEERTQLVGQATAEAAGPAAGGGGGLAAMLGGEAPDGGGQEGGAGGTLLGL